MNPNNPLLTLALAACLAVVGCTDDKPKPKPQPPAPPAAKAGHNPNPWDHSGEVPVTDQQKQQFERQFAEQCVRRETAAGNADAKQVARPCRCIAQFMAKNLTPQEAEKFLGEHENPHSLAIKYENAAYHCLQQRQPPHEADFSRP